MKAYTSAEAAQYLGVSVATIGLWETNKVLLHDVIVKGCRGYSEDLLIRTKRDKEFKTKDRKLVVLTLNENIINYHPQIFANFYGKVDEDDRYECKKFFGVPEDELLGNEDFMKLIDELSGKYIYRLIVFKSDFKKGSNILNLLKTICNGARISFKIVEGGEVDEE